MIAAFHKYFFKPDGNDSGKGNPLEVTVLTFECPDPFGRLGGSLQKAAEENKAC